MLQQFSQCSECISARIFGCLPAAYSARTVPVPPGLTPIVSAAFGHLPGYSGKHPLSLETGQLQIVLLRPTYLRQDAKVIIKLQKLSSQKKKKGS